MIGFSVTFLLALVFSRTDGAFSPVSVPGEAERVTVLKLGLCNDPATNFHSTKILFTIEPAETVRISSEPANLVKTLVEGNVLSFSINKDVSQNASSGGVRIGLPANQLQKIHATSAATAQIIKGFTALRLLEANSAASLQADLTENSSDNLAIESSSAASMVVTVNKGILKLQVSSSATLQLTAGPGASIETLVASSAAVAAIQAVSIKQVSVSTASAVQLTGATIEKGFVSTASSLLTTVSCEKVAQSLTGVCRESTSVMTPKSVSVGSVFKATGKVHCGSSNVGGIVCVGSVCNTSVNGCVGLFCGPSAGITK